MSKQGSLYIPEKSSKRWQKICDKQTDTEKKDGMWEPRI